MITIYIFIVGLCFGSFANVIIYRFPRKISIISPPSFCIFCKKKLSFFDLLPIISYTVLLGKCRYCRKPINLRYPLIECICAIIFVVNFTLYPVIMFVPLTILAFVLLCVASIDYDTQIISDVFIIILAITGIFWLIFAEFLGIMHNIPQNILQNALIAVLVGALPLWIIDKLTLLFLKQDGFGYGDIKLMGVVGLFLGWQLILVAYLFAFVAGGAVATVLLATKQAKPGQYIAFAPFLAIGIMLALWFGKFFIFL